MPTFGVAADLSGNNVGIEEKLPAGFLLTTVEKLAGYIRKSSLWPVQILKDLGFAIGFYIFPMPHWFDIPNAILMGVAVILTISTGIYYFREILSLHRS